jgi:hypothetical protein
MDTVTIENRQDAITFLNMLIRRELTDKTDIQVVLEKIREAIERYKI